MVYSASPVGAALHVLSSLAGPEPRRRCRPSTWRPLSNMSACTTTSMESGWQSTTTGRGRVLGTATCCCLTTANGDCVLPWVPLEMWRPPAPGARLYTNLLSVCVQSEIRTIIHQKGMLWGSRSILGLERIWKGRRYPAASEHITAAARNLRSFKPSKHTWAQGLTYYNASVSPSIYSGLPETSQHKGLSSYRPKNK